MHGIAGCTAQRRAHASAFRASARWLAVCEGAGHIVPSPACVGRDGWGSCDQAPSCQDLHDPHPHPFLPARGKGVHCCTRLRCVSACICGIDERAAACIFTCQTAQQACLIGPCLDLRAWGAARLPLSFLPPNARGGAPRGACPGFRQGGPGLTGRTTRTGPGCIMRDASRVQLRATRHRWLSPLTAAGPDRDLIPAGCPATARGVASVVGSPRARVPHPVPPS